MVSQKNEASHLDSRGVISFPLFKGTKSTEVKDRIHLRSKNVPRFPTKVDKFTIIPGIIPIIISSPHTYPHIRPGFTKDKPKNGETGLYNLTKTLCMRTKSWGIIADSLQLLDPNWYSTSPYRQILHELISKNNLKLLVDLHGFRDENLIFSFRYNKFIKNNHINLIKNILQKYKILKNSVEFRSLVVNNQETLCESVEKFKIPAIEVEISNKMRGSAFRSNLEVIFSEIILSLNKDV